MKSVAIIELLERRLDKRERDHAIAWRRYQRAIRDSFPVETVVNRFRTDVEKSLARYDECVLILNQIKRMQKRRAA
jgi:hypothetical protein